MVRTKEKGNLLWAYQWAGSVVSAIAIFNIIQRTTSLGLFSAFAKILDTYRDIVRPIHDLFSWAFRNTGFHPTQFYMDLFVISSVALLGYLRAIFIVDGLAEKLNFSYVRSNLIGVLAILVVGFCMFAYAAIFLTGILILVATFSLLFRNPNRVEAEEFRKQFVEERQIAFSIYGGVLGATIFVLMNSALAAVFPNH